MSNRIIGYCFTRGYKRPDDSLKELNGLKKVMVAGVVYLPVDFKSEELTYEISADLSLEQIENQCFGDGKENTDRLILKLQNPQSVIDPKNGYRIDQILTAPYLWIPNYNEADHD